MDTEALPGSDARKVAREERRAAGVAVRVSGKKAEAPMVERR
jgi:hypothetical protein